MKVLKFAIGFGPKIFHKQGKETEYSLRAIPLGGFVQLEGEDEESNDGRAFSNKPKWQRFLVLIAGITMNILLALFIYLCIYMNINDYGTTKILQDDDGTFLSSCGLVAGDEILKINGEKVLNDSDIFRIIKESSYDDFSLLIKSVNGETKTIDINVPQVDIGFIGVMFEGKKVNRLISGGAGERDGLLEGDEVLCINNNSGDIYTLLEILKSNPNKELDFLVLRDDKQIELKITPDATKSRVFNISFVELKDLDFFYNLYYAWKETRYYLKANLIGFAELFSGKTENVEVQGIVGVSKQISSTQTIIEFFYFMSAISLSLGIMNLLPIPGLDGGKILVLLIEVIRRKPMSKETEAKITLVGFTALLLLMILVTISDISKL